MNSIREAANLNNEAIRILSVGESRQAFRTLKKSLEEINNDDELINQIENATQEYSAKTASHLIMSVVPIDAPNYDESHLFIYKQALALNVDAVAPMDFKFCCAVIMFNMALTMHTGANFDKSSTQKKILQLYNASLAFLDDVSTIKEYCTLRIVILNNKAQICHELCEYKEVTKTFGLILETLSSDEQRSCLDEQSESSILCNAIFLKVPTHAGAA